MLQIGCYISALLVLLLLQDLGLSHAELFNKQLTIFADAGRLECYHQPIAASENIRIDYQVIHGGLGEPHINFNLMDPGRRLLITDVKQEKGAHKLVARETGSYKLCFDNTISSFNQKIVAFTLEVTAADKEEQELRTLRKEMLTDYQFDLAYTSIYNNIDKIRVNFHRSRQTQDFIRTIEARDRHVAECNFERVNIWSCLQLSAMIIVGCMQVIMAQCASLRITDCGQLIRQWPKEAILRDEVCNSQCGIYMTGQQASGFNPQQHQGQAQPRVTRSRNQNLFKFPDLTPFIASL